MSDKNLLTHLDSYCERAGDPSIWAEPINTISNVAFIIAGILAFMAWRNKGAPFRKSADILLLVLLLVTIGFGSGAWHLYATPETLKMDVIPIVLFMNVFLLAASIRLLGLSWIGAVLLFVLFQGMNVAAQKFLPSDFLNGTIMYVPAYALLFGMSLWLHIRKHPAKHLMFQALFIWTFSLIFRTYDNELCAVLPIGTHFLWHLLNAVVLYRLLNALILAQAIGNKGR